MSLKRTNTSSHGMLSRLWALPAAVILAALLAGCGGAESETVPAAGAEPVSVLARAAQLAGESAGVRATGTVEPITRAMPGTKIMGRVARVPAREGERVEKGDLLAALESADLEAAVAQARAAVTMAEARLENARAMRERMVDLHERGSVTEKNLEDAEAGFRVAEAGLAEASARVRSAEVTLSYARIESPIDGYVVERRVEAGDMASPGMPLFVIEDLSRVKLIVQVPEADVVGIEEGDASRVSVDVLRKEWDADVHRVLPSADRMSRTFDIELRLDNEDGRLRSGMFARARFPRGERRVIAVAREDLVQRGQLEGVFVVEGDQARLRWLRLGTPLDQGRVEVLSGLEPGEIYVTNPPPALADGAPVSVR